MGRASLTGSLLAGCWLLLACGGSAHVAGGGDAGAGAAGGAAAAPPSCAERRPGADLHCGLAKDLDCCASTALPGGSFDRLNNPKWPATLSPFRLDVLEVTVGRFRAFVDAYPGSRPLPGEGAHPLIAGSGWQAQWDSELPPTREGLLERLRCPPEVVECNAYASWTPEPSGKAYVPMTILDWYAAFAFCAWDGGRLPTSAEWSFAISGGHEQRSYPWGDQPVPDSAHTVSTETPEAWLVPAGSRPLGAARWGQLDMNGSRVEWTLDQKTADDPLLLPCTDCAAIDPSAPTRVMHDMGFFQYAPMPSGYEMSGVAAMTSEVLGFRCARSL